MNYNSIKELLEKFYAGETTLKEEDALKRFFAEEVVPDRLKADQELFRAMVASEQEEVLGDDFDEIVLSQLEGSSFRWGRHEWIYTLSGLAAAAVIVISLWIGGVFAPQRPLPGTINNPQMAYAETRKALAEVSDNLNKGFAPVQSATKKLDEPVRQMSKFEDMQAALKKVKYLEQINTAQELMRSFNSVYINLGIRK